MKIKNSQVYNILVIITGVLVFKLLNSYVSYDQQAHIDFSVNMFKLNADEIRALGLPYQAITYPVYHLLVKALAYFFDSPLYLTGVNSYYLASAFVQTISVVISIYVYRCILNEMVTDSTTKNRVLADFLSIAAVLFGVARCWLNDWRFYQLQGAPNPWHNPTILVVRPIGLLAILFFFRYSKKYSKNEKCLTDIILFGIFMLLSILTKPSYAFVYLPALAIETIIKMLQDKSIKYGCINLITVFPSIVLLLWQYSFMSDETSMMELKVQFGSFSGLSFWKVIGATLVTLPIPIILFSARNMKKCLEYRVAMIALGIGWIQMFFLTNGPTGDFSWGYDLSVQLATIVAMLLAICENNKKGVKWSALVIFVCQTITGIQYMYLLYINGDFWI